MSGTGWIKLHRQVMDHWIWEDPIRFKWWMEIILLTNHTDKKTIIGNEVVIIERGTFHTSELKLSEKWGVSRNRVRRFLDLLENDGMISTKKTINGTTIKVHNYGVYQGNEEQKKQPTIQQTEQQTKQPTIQQTEHRTDIERYKTKNVKNDKELKNDKNVKNTTTDSPEFAKLFQKFESKINPSRAISIIDYLSQDIDRYGYEIVDYAFDETIKRHKTNYGYAQSIMSRCEAENITTRAQAEKRSAIKTQSTSKEITPEWLKNENIEQQKSPEEEAELERERIKLQKELDSLWEE